MKFKFVKFDKFEFITKISKKNILEKISNLDIVKGVRPMPLTREFLKSCKEEHEDEDKDESPATI